MQLFFHHVGQVGAAEDFPKTVFRRVPISVVRDHVPDEVQIKEQLIGELVNEFPDGWFNCWGTPSGSVSVIKKLSVDDAVLLIETTANEGSIPVLCFVQSFPNTMLPSLSKHLWGDARFTYIFFFTTTVLNYNWQQLCEDLGYKPNYEPRGQFLKVAESRILENGWKGVSDFVNYLLNNYPGGSEITYEHIKTKVIKETPSKDQNYVFETEAELSRFYRLAESPPILIDETEVMPQIVKVTPRDAAFRGSIRQMYGNRCAVCQLSLETPDQSPEVQSAHIYPKAQKGYDDPRNGICLCRLHHWALDVGWFSITDHLTIILRDSLPSEDSYDFIRRYEGRKIAVPLHDHLAPHPLFLSAHRKLHGFE
jgi:hypothetical protein